jgi:proline iminopeptidase
MIKVYDEGYLSVSDVHQVWYGQYGNPDGHPIVWLHGGPGAGCSGCEAEYFDTNFYRVILFDQRGSGRSKPFCELRENNTQNLISDLEVLRAHLNIDKWSILGGSWGSLLALCYSIAHRDKVGGLILRGVFTGTEAEVSHLWYGMRGTFPDIWQDLYEFLPTAERSDLPKAYMQRMLHDDIGISLPAIKAFVKYDTICAYHEMNDSILKESLHQTDRMMSLAKTFAHYSANDFFIPPLYVAKHLTSITNLPCIIVQGRYDVICLPSIAYELHQKWPNSILHIVPSGGHTIREEAMERAVKNAANELIRYL